MNMGDQMDACLIIVGLLETIERAQSSGDWVADGACDPDMIVNQANGYLRANGWTQNGIDGSWMLTREY